MVLKRGDDATVTSLRILLLSLVLVSPSLAKSIEDAPALTAPERKQLESGEMVFRPAKPGGPEGVSFVAMGLIQAPSRSVWPVVRDCQHYKDFMPRTVVSERRNTKGNRSVCYVKLSMPFPLSDMESLVNSFETIGPQGRYRRHWTLIEGSYTRNTGSWTLYPFGAESKWTLAVYSIDINPRVSVPDFLIRKAQKGSLPEIFDAIAARVRMIP